MKTTIQQPSHPMLWAIITWSLWALLAGCASANPTQAVDTDAPAFVDPLPSPTPTWAAPDPDDEDPIVDCALDTPLCVIDVALVEVVGEPFLGVELQIVPVPGKWEPGDGGTVHLDVDIAVQRDGETVSEISTEGQSVALAQAGGAILLNGGGSTPLLRVDTSDQGVLLMDPDPSPGLAAAYDPSTEDLLLLDDEGNPIATVGAGGIGVLLADPRPSPIYHLSEDPTAGGYLIFNAEEEPLVRVDASNATVWLLDPSGDRLVGIVMLNGLVVIAAPQGGPVAIVHPEAGGGEGATIRITRLIPLSFDLQGEYSLSGSLELVTVDQAGERTLLGKSEVDEKGNVASLGKVPNPTPTTSPIGRKSTPTVPAKSTAPPKATTTPAPPKPTATSSGGKATPGK